MTARKKLERRKAHRKAISKYRGGPKYHLDAAKEGSYSIEHSKGWTYRDNPPDAPVQDGMDAIKRIENFLSISMNPDAHYVLKDRSGTPRFVLRHFEDGGVHFIGGVQRMRSPGAYVEVGTGKYRWDAKREKELSRDFKKELGMDPAEFLLSEFISRNAFHINTRLGNGQTPLELRRFPLTVEPGVYQPLIKKFFKKDPEGRIVLDPKKERVKALLGL